MSKLHMSEQIKNLLEFVGGVADKWSLNHIVSKVQVHPKVLLTDGLVL